MLYDVSQVLKAFGETLEISGTVDVENSAPCGAEPVFEALSFCGTVTNIGGVLQLKAEATGTYKVLCSRCAKEIKVNFNQSFTEILINSETATTEDKDDAVIFEGHFVDISEIVLANALLSLPSTFLCKENCKGLCPKCGADLNEGTCSCADDETDPRWEALKNFVTYDSE